MNTDHRGVPVGKNHVSFPKSTRRFEYPGSEELDEWAPEDIAEQQYWERANSNVNLGYHPNHENDLPSHMKYGW